MSCDSMDQVKCARQITGNKKYIIQRDVKHVKRDGLHFCKDTETA